LEQMESGEEEKGPAELTKDGGENARPKLEVWPPWAAKAGGRGAK